MNRFTLLRISLVCTTCIMASEIKALSNFGCAVYNVLFVPCSIQSILPPVNNTANTKLVQTQNKVTLDIKDISDSADCPEGYGWCGEDCIKMAAAYFGAYIPQKYINKIANPIHPDLYSNDIPVSLNRLRLNTGYPDSSLDILKFKDWIKDSLIESHPVLFGVKLKNDGNPMWSLDHFVLAVGFDGDNIIFNSNNFGLGTISGSLTDRAEPLTLVNSFNKYYGIEIKGFDFSDNSFPVKLNIKNEYPDSHLAEVNIECMTYDAAKKYTVIKYMATQDMPYLDLNNMLPESKISFYGQRTFSFLDIVDTNTVTIYRCYLSE